VFVRNCPQTARRCHELSGYNYSYVFQCVRFEALAAVPV
jgi:hypothetical protein